MKRLLTLATAFLVASCGRGTAEGAPPRPEAFTIAVVSDFHMALDKLKNAFADVTAQGADTMVIVGDSCDGQEHEYEDIKRVLATTPHPANLFFTMGNHEYYAGYHKDGSDYDETGFPNGETSSKCRERFNRFRGADPKGPVYFDAWVRGCHFIFLAGERSRMDDPKFLDDAVLTRPQLRWLKEKLNERVQPGKPILVFLHQPFPGTVSGSRSNGSIRQNRELNDTLARHPQILFFSGDTHWELNLPTTHYASRSHAFNLFNTSSLRDPYDAKDEAIDRNMSEGLLVEVLPGKVIVKGRDFLGHRFIEGQTYSLRIP